MKSFNFLLPNRPEKPRNNGLTMALDKGLGYEAAKSLMEIAGDYVDLLKFGWGTIIIHDRDIIMNKIKMYKSFDISPYPGGTLFEIAYTQNKVSKYFKEASEMGFEVIEISDGSTNMKTEEKLDFIATAKDKGFHVISEVGKKDPNEDSKIDLDSRIELIKNEIKAGSSKVIIEAREGGKNIGIFDKSGNAKDKEVNYLLENLPNDKIIWEAPNKDQQIYLVLKIGRDVNLGNISSNDISSLETIRRGLRGDTLGKV
ncbi:MAG: phosphosulfolactate synthase [Methanobacteriaceae archaeon]|jgi:phosphosulfolactate synthase|nr:phosphosulfolactate synthase [Candidatus Methanorudis spinitermitis]